MYDIFHLKSLNLDIWIVLFSNNVCDISGQLPYQIFWQCVWQIRRTVSLYHPIFRQCPWHIRSTTLLKFLTMCVTYQVNLIIQFSDNVCCKSDKLYHCIISFSDNVCDISGELPCQISCQCVWHIRTTIWPYHPIFLQCPWHIRPTTLSNSLTMFATYHGDCITVLSHFLTMSKTYQANYLVKYSDNVC